MAPHPPLQIVFLQGLHSVKGTGTQVKVTGSQLWPPMHRVSAIFLAQVEFAVWIQASGAALGQSGAVRLVFCPLNLALPPPPVSACLPSLSTHLPPPASCFQCLQNTE